MLSLSKHEVGGVRGSSFAPRQARGEEAQDEGLGKALGAYVYILRCRDGKYYVGTTREALEKRINEHNSGILGGFTSSRRPVGLVFSEHFDRITDAVAAERQIKGWSRAKKEALMRGDFEGLKELARAKAQSSHPSTGSG